MDRRFATFLGMAFAILAINQVVAYLFRPPAQQVAQLDAEKKADKKKDAKKGDEKQAAEKAVKVNGKDADPQAPAGDKPQEAEKPAPDQAPDAAAAARLFPAKTIALGSLANSGPYRMLVTLTTSGAAVERVELNSPRYQQLEDPAIRPVAGYLGRLSPSDGKPGARVQVVGPGTPAAAAGVQVGDAIKSVNKITVADALGLQSALDQTKPGDTVEIVAERGGNPVTLTAALTREPLQLIAPEYKSKELDVVTGQEHDQLSLLLAIKRIDGIDLKENDAAVQAMREGNWEVVNESPDGVAFRWTLAERELEIIKRFTLAKVDADDSAPGYHVNMQIEIRNTGQQPKNIVYQLDGPTGLPLEGAWYANKISRNWGGSGLRDVLIRFEGKNEPNEIGCVKIADGDAKPPANEKLRIDYAGVDAQYFASVVIPQYAAPGDSWFDDVMPLRVGAVPEDKNAKKLTDISFGLVSRPHELAAGDKLQHDFVVFAGPKKPDVLDQYVVGKNNLGDLVSYGYFGWVARPMLAILHTFHAIVRNYGIAILMLTVLVRGCMFPLSRKQAVSAQMMQQLQPQIKALNEKYKKDPAARTKAQQELFRKHNYNPLGGCLLMFVQLPIFLGLYRSLMVDVELRQAPLFGEAVRWCSNLAAPDMFWDWSHVMPHFVSFGTGFFGLGPYLNLLPLVTIGLFIWQQKMFMPPPADEQAALQQKMMQYMMIFMGIMFYKVASGLCLYFIASSLWGIAERKLLPKAIGATGGGPTTDTPRSNPSGGSAGGNGATGGKKKQRDRK